VQITAFIESSGQRSLFPIARQRRVWRVILTRFDPVCPIEVTAAKSSGCGESRSPFFVSKVFSGRISSQ
jgi:hypothetical protein